MILVPTKFWYPILSVALALTLASCESVTLTPPTKTPVTTPQVASVSVTATKALLAVGSMVTLTAKVLPENTGETVKWSTSAPSVASVESTGDVVGLAAGTTVITATAGTKTASLTVTVVIPVTAVSLSPTALTIAVSDVISLTPTLTPLNATDPSLVWSSSQEGVASVSSSGAVTAKLPGQTTIAVTTNDGGFVDSVTVTVIEASSSVSVTPTNATLAIGDKVLLKAKVLVTNAGDIKWSTSAPSVASVDDTGMVLGLAAGSAVITATAGTKKASATIKVLGTGVSQVAFTWASQGLSFDNSQVNLVVGSDALELKPSTGFDTGNTSAWSWTVNGMVVGNDPTFVFAPSARGFYTLSVTVLKNGLYYSGSLTITVAQ